MQRERARAASSAEARRRFSDRRADSAARARDLFVRFSGNALLVFVRAARGENQVRVRIDEAGKNHAAAEIELFGAARLLQALDAAARADRRDAIAVDEQRAIANQAQFREGSSAARDGAAQREQLRAAGNQPVGHDSGPDTNAYGVKHYRNWSADHPASES